MKPLDDSLSSLDLRLWTLVHEILLRWNTLVVFKACGINVPQGTPGSILFVVPADATFAYEIGQFLHDELVGCTSDDVEFDGVMVPGTDVQVETGTFRGFYPYLDQEQTRQMIDEFMRQLRQRPKPKDDHD